MYVQIIVTEVVRKKVELRLMRMMCRAGGCNACLEPVRLFPLGPHSW
jgi:hypothetical protein